MGCFIAHRVFLSPYPRGEPAAAERASASAVRTAVHLLSSRRVGCPRIGQPYSTHYGRVGFVSSSVSLSVSVPVPLSPSLDDGFTSLSLPGPLETTPKPQPNFDRIGIQKKTGVRHEETEGGVGGSGTTNFFWRTFFSSHRAGGEQGVEPFNSHLTTFRCFHLSRDFVFRRRWAVHRQHDIFGTHPLITD